MRSGPSLDGHVETETSLPHVASTAPADEDKQIVWIYIRTVTMPSPTKEVAVMRADQGGGGLRHKAG